MGKFGERGLTDFKRLARGEHLLLARTKLRARDHVHNAPWKVLMTAGGCPGGEISAIRELMPRAFIVAVDKDELCVRKAEEAGADRSIVCDLSDVVASIAGGKTTVSPKCLYEFGRFDLIDLDLCSNVNRQTRFLTKTYTNLLSARGVMMLTVSYGRDVVEAIYDEAGSFASRSADFERLYDAWVQPLVAARVYYLLKGWLGKLQSLIIYPGSVMPMMSMLIERRDYYNTSIKSLSFIKLAEGDFELAVTHPDPGKLYDCPQERIQSLRRSQAAHKAMATKRTNAAIQKSLL
jgi:hypothetical protein